MSTSASSSKWLEQRLPDGRKYWYNIYNGESCWEEPAELRQSSASHPTTTTIGTMPTVNSSTTGTTSKKLSNSNADITASWRELTAADGRKYYYNAVTKVTLWDIPLDYADYLERVRDPSRMDRETLEAKFMTMLKESGITSKMAWEEALRIIFGHPNYKLVPTLLERKALFAKYIQLQREVEREEQQQLASKRRQEFVNLLRSTPQITSDSRFSEIVPLIEKEAAFVAIESSRERSDLFYDFVDVLYREEAERKRNQRAISTEKLSKLMISLPEITLKTSWKEFQKILSTQNDPDLLNMDQVDKLICFEDFIKNLEKQEHEKLMEAKHARRRKERLARKHFKELLCNLSEKGILTATTSWSMLYPKIKDNSAFIDLIPQPGSTPLDLFWDHLHQLQNIYISECKSIIMGLKEQHSTENNGKWLNTLVEDSIESLDLPSELSNIHKECLHSHLFPNKESSLYGNLLSPSERLRIRIKVDEYRRENRRLVDNLKKSIKHFDPPIQIDSLYSAVLPLIKMNSEFDFIKDDEIIRYYFDKYILHLRKKAGLDKDVKSDNEE